MKLEILKNTLIKERRYVLELAAPSNFKKSSPGQFVHIRMEDSCDPLLRRPLSIYSCEEDKKKSGVVLKIFYEVVGRGTELLSQKKPSAQLDVLGPLGNGFDLTRIAGAQNIYLVAGGMGVAPLFFLAGKIKEAVSHKSQVTSKVTVLIGAKTKEHIVCEKEFKKLGCAVHIATDDGSKGFKGRVPDLLKKILVSSIENRASSICACGPKPMLAAVSEISLRNNITTQVSMEEFMGCGLGACLGCVIRTTAGYKRICHDGPVFDSKDIIWR